MRLDKLIVHQFLSVEHAEVDFSGSGLTLVLGDVQDSLSSSNNGAGKSAVYVEPLNWLFFNTLIRKPNWATRVKRNYHGAPVSDQTYVEFRGEIKGSPAVVRRTLETGYSVEYGTGEAAPYGKSEGEKYVRSMLGIDTRMFQTVCCLGQGFPSKFSDFGDADRASILESFVDLSVYEQGQKNAQESQSVYNNAIITLQVSLKQFDAELGRIDAAILQVEEQAAIAANSVATDVTGWQQRYQVVYQDYEKYVKEKSQCEASLKAINADLLALHVRWVPLVSERDNLLRQQSILQATIQAGRSKLKCDRCTQPLSPTLAETLIAGDIAILASIDASLPVLQNQITEIENQKRSLTAGLEATSTYLTTVNSWLSSLSTEAAGLQENISRASAAMPDFSGQLTALRAQRAGVAASRSGAQVTLDQANKLLPQLAWWSDGFSLKGSRTMLLGGTVDRANELLLEYSDKLFSRELVVQLSVEKVQKTANTKPGISLQVWGPSGSYELASGGQCRKIDLALNMTVRRMCQDAAQWSCNVIIADEILDHLDQRSAARAVDTLLSEPGVERVFLISHDPGLSAMCKDVRTVRYRDETSVLT